MGIIHNLLNINSAYAYSYNICLHFILQT